MNITFESAKALVAQLEAASAQCSKSLSVVKANDGIGELQVYARLVGLFLGHSYTNVLGPIWDRFPELEPESFRQPYAERVASLSSESQAAISEFLTLAKPALTEAARVLSSEEGTAALPFGGLPEVERSVAEIEVFLLNPRFREPEAERRREP